jgi:hypothetical protein
MAKNSTGRKASIGPPAGRGRRRVRVAGRALVTGVVEREVGGVAGDAGRGAGAAGAAAVRGVVAGHGPFEVARERIVPDRNRGVAEVARDQLVAKPGREAVVGDQRRNLPTRGSSSPATIDALPLEATGEVPCRPPERREPTLHRVLVHMIAETERHAGHADIVRELIDGSVGIRAEHSSLADGDAAWWTTYRDRVEQAAKDAGSR